MDLNKFLTEIQVPGRDYYSTTIAADIIGKMSSEKFQKLCEQMKRKDVPPVTIIKVNSDISGRVEFSFDNPDVFEKVKSIFLKAIEEATIK